MSLWRKEATARMPELQRLISSKLVDGPMMLWIELNLEFERLSGLPEVPIGLLKRIWSYCDWCLSHESDDVQTAAALGFAEHLLDTPARIKILPQVMKKSDFMGVRELLEYHNSREDIDRHFKTLWP